MGDQMAAPGTVLITTADGVVQSLVSELEAGEGVEEYTGILCPGFINCHCHLELSFLKDEIPERTGLVDFLAQVMHWRSRPIDEEELKRKVRQAIAAGEQEMVDNGIVAVGDICNTTDTLEQKQLARIHYHNFIETAGFIEQSADTRFLQSHQVFQRFAGDPKIPVGSNSMVPHAPYSVSPALFRRLAGHPGNRLLTIHNQESDAENEFLETGTGDFLRLYAQLGLDVSFFHGTGQRSLASILPFFNPNQKLILVHNVATGEADLGQPGPGQIICLCPNANLYIGGRLPDIGLFIDRACRIVVGTDSLASNHQLSILAELRALQHAFPWLNISTLLQWATSNGAAALEIDGTYGSFAQGKKPGVLHLEGLANGQLAERTTVKRLI